MDREHPHSGGAHVPGVGGVHPGQLATFVCQSISHGRSPSMRGCSLQTVQEPDAPAKPGEPVTLW